MSRAGAPVPFQAGGAGANTRVRRRQQTRKHKGRHPRVLAVILAGGQGGRLDVLTEERAKPALPFAGTYRLIDFPLSNCANSGISDVWIVEQYRPHPLNEHLANGRPWDLDRMRGGLQVLPPYQNRKPDGTESGFAEGNADALYRNRGLIREFDADLLLVLSADHVYALDYRDVIDAHLGRDDAADVTLVTTPAPPGEAHRFGNVTVNRQGRVTAFAYKPDAPQSDLATAEVFVYDAPRLLDTLEHLAANTSPGDSGAPLKDFGHELLPHLVDTGRAWAFPLDGYWRDVGTIPSYWQAHQDLLAPEPPIVLDDPAWPIRTRGPERLPARILAGARVADSLVAPGCRIAGRVERSVLSPGVVVEEGAVVRDAVLLHDAHVGADASVVGAIVDEGARIGDGARVGPSPRGGAKDRRGDGDAITLIGRGARIAPGAAVPAGSHVPPRQAPGA
jgi:glucose-1-phosphate adenylyltransferase